MQMAVVVVVHNMMRKMSTRIVELLYVLVRSEKAYRFLFLGMNERRSKLPVDVEVTLIPISSYC